MDDALNVFETDMFVIFSYGVQYQSVRHPTAQSSRYNSTTVHDSRLTIADSHDATPATHGCVTVGLR